ncbi:MAG: 6-phosphogluconolactonase [Planctomycetes bacterium]|nr:6-phosphogluconolactonase [Planctomycetota bacterium]
MTRLVIDDEDAYAEIAARIVADLITQAVDARGRCAIALAGGSTPRPIYRVLANEDVPWHGVDVYFGDERAVGPDDPESNFSMSRAELLEPIAMPPERVHRMEGELDDLGRAARRYEVVLAPVLDLILLGMGKDGHIASLFPGGAALTERERRVVETEAPFEPRRRLTITPPVLEAARSVIVLVRGRGKAEKVARALEGELDPLLVPAQLVRDRRWILDAGAASELRERT